MEAGTPTPPEVEQNDGYDPNHSPLWYLLASVPLLGWTGTSESGSFHYWGWLALILSDLRPAPGRVPVVCGAQALRKRRWPHCADAILRFARDPRSSTLYAAQPEMGAAWGAFGAIFTAIAAAHTLYAPREVVVGTGGAFYRSDSHSRSHSARSSTGHPDSDRARVTSSGADEAASGGCDWRQRAGSCSCLCSLAIRSVQAFWRAFAMPLSFFGITWSASLARGTYTRVAQTGQSGPVLLLAIPIASIDISAWRRSDIGDGL